MKLLGIKCRKVDEAIQITQEEFNDIFPEDCEHDVIYCTYFDESFEFIKKKKQFKCFIAINTVYTGGIGDYIIKTSEGKIKIISQREFIEDYDVVYEREYERY